VETLCAMVVLGVGLVGLTEGVTAALRTARESELQSAAVLYAAGRIEELRAEGYLTDGETEGECEEPLSRYRWRRSVSPAELDGLREVAVVLEDSREGRVVCELRTLLFEPPLDAAESRDRERERERARTRREVGR